MNHQVKIKRMLNLHTNHDGAYHQPTPKLHYSLDELLAQCDLSVKISKQDRTWLDGRPTGDELL